MQATKNYTLGPLIFYFVLSIGFSFLCSILEAVLLSVTPAYVTQQVSRKSYTGRLLQDYKNDIDTPLSAILTLNTVAHTLGAIGVGVEAAKIFGENAVEIIGLKISFEAIIAGTMTLLILILSEIIPKTLGANNWKNLAPFTVRALRIIIWILFPFVWMSKLITGMLKKDKTKSVFSRADFAAIAAEGEASGALAKDESMIINNLLNFEKGKVRDIMTPRTVAFMVNEEATLTDFINDPQANTFSRIPVFDKDKDNIVGIVLKDDVLSAYNRLNEDEDLFIKEILRPVKFVSDQMPLFELFDNLTKDKQHLSIVKDEFGNVLGLVTMEDVFETLLGREIMDESDKVVDLQAYAKKKAKEL